jgi:pimeloyl-ACP methyl ester carboxylesterase
MIDRTSSVVADGVTLAVHRAGRGTPVVCLTALLHDAHDFDAFMERAADRYEIVCIEWPGHGDSMDDETPPSSRRYGELLVKALDQLQIRNPIVIGNSIGGGAAICYASQRPVRGLVLCDSSGLVEITPAVQRFCRLFERLFAAAERRAFWFKPVFWMYYRMVLTEPAAAAQRQRIVELAPTRATLLRRAWHGFGQPSANLIDLAVSLDAPIWVAWARSDRTIPLKYCLPAIRRLKKATLTQFEGGHTPFLEQPDAFAQAFLNFAAQLPA